MKIFGREPALWLEGLRAVLVVAALLFTGLTTEVQTATMVIATAVFGLLQAVMTRPFQVAAIKTFIETIGVAIVAYGIDVTPTTLAAVVLLSGAITALISRAQISPANELPPA